MRRERGGIEGLVTRNRGCHHLRQWLRGNQPLPCPSQHPFQRTCAPGSGNLYWHIMNCSISKCILERMPREHNTPQLPETLPQTSKKGAEKRGGRRTMQDPGDPKTKKPHPRHTHLPAEAPQSALTGDACGHSRQRSPQARVPEPPGPTP